jgi:hypothetical protein
MACGRARHTCLAKEAGPVSATGAIEGTVSLWTVLANRFRLLFLPRLFLPFSIPR